jgi:hypothetical protein
MDRNAMVAALLCQKFDEGAIAADYAGLRPPSILREAPRCWLARSAASHPSTIHSMECRISQQQFQPVAKPLSSMTQIRALVWENSPP